MKRTVLYIFFIINVAFIQLSGARIISGKVVDAYNQQPIPGAQVCFGPKLTTTSNDTGYFVFPDALLPIDEDKDYEIKILNSKINWRSNNDIYVSIYNYMGQVAAFNYLLKAGSGEIGLPHLVRSIYLISFLCNNKRKTYKIWGSENSLKVVQENSKPANYVGSTDSLLIISNGYFTEKYAVKSNGGAYQLLKNQYSNLDHFERLIRPEAYTMVQSLPLIPVFGEVKSVKIIYSISDGKLFYINSGKYMVHYDFAEKILGYNKGHEAFNSEQYSDNPNRIYYLATINHFTSSNIYTLEFFPTDVIDCDKIKMVYDRIVSSSFIGKKLRFYANSGKWNACTSVNSISADELYAGQNYQPLNAQENFGYLRKIKISEVDNTYPGRHDIVLINGIPVDISVVAGIITTEFQTPLSHINVLSHNRGTPNMGLRDGWTNPKANNFLDKLVYFKVTLDSFCIREASLAEAQKFWAEHEPGQHHMLELDTITNGLIDLSSSNVSSVKTVGGKAANIAELTKVEVKSYGKLPLPEGIFAIPFYYYWQHIKEYGLDKYIDKMLKDTLFFKDYSYKKLKLDTLQDSIKHSPIDTRLLTIVKNKLSVVAGYTAFRFRSSTNSEDIAGFNGAGLYNSYTGSLADPDKPIEKAIRKTWASLWNIQAFEEREYFKIDHKTVAMGVLVHRSFPAEAANGVVITQNIYNTRSSGITINVQIGEISIVKPVDNYLPDQIIYYNSDIEYINHSNVPGMEGKTVMSDAELQVLKNYCMAIHYHYCRINFECHPMDIEFKVDVVNGERKIYIKQARLY